MQEQKNRASGIVGRVDFDAFGVPLHTSSSQSVIGFTGAITDPETGFVYVRARYYDPSTGRFLTRDLLPGIQRESASQNGFSYAKDNPTRSYDPSGKDGNPPDVGGCAPDPND